MPAVQVIRAGQGPTVHSEQSGCVATLLSASPPRARRDIYCVWLEPDTARDSEPHIPGTVEHIVMSAGKVKAGPRGESAEPEAGDHMSYRGDLPHAYEPPTPGTKFVPIMQHA
ncbi:hypothetical protein [Streptomyces sp. NPDC046197]|uniref:hypothetical protein n=1 Tax=Streptomyces sp. NPDC046197 TaxID=3154337 RepID=UPI0033D17D7B